MLIHFLLILIAIKYFHLYFYLFQQNVSTTDRITIQVADISPETADTVLAVKTLTQDLCDCEC